MLLSLSLFFLFECCIDKEIVDVTGVCMLAVQTDEVRRSVRVWQRVVSSDKLTVEQRKLLESFCITVRDGRPLTEDP